MPCGTRYEWNPIRQVDLREVVPHERPWSLDQGINQDHVTGLETGEKAQVTSGLDGAVIAVPF